jgi:hypothetical protein
MSPVLLIVLLSAPAGALCGLLFRLLVPGDLPERMRRILALVTGMILHISSPAAVASMALASVGRTLLLVASMLPALLASAVPFLIAAAQVEARFGHRLPDVALVVLRDPGGLPAPVGGSVIPPVVRNGPLTAFRVATGPGSEVRLGDMPLSVSDVPSGRVLVRRWSRSRLAAFLDPSVARAGFEGSIETAPARYLCAGTGTGWLPPFLAATSAGAAAGALLPRRRRVRSCTPGPRACA